MDILTIDDKSFVKASRIARDLGYTSDYVGQLCRGNKVEAKLVGRTWYVEQDSIKTHKENRYKKDPSNTPQLTEENNSLGTHSVKLHKVATDTSQKSIKKLHFLDHTEKTPVRTSYTSDEAELIPGEKSAVRVKSGKLHVDLADANSISITSKSHTYDFSTPARPKLSFKGNITVKDIPEINPVQLPEEPDLEELVDAKKNTFAGKAIISHKKDTQPNMKDIARKGTLQRNPELGTLSIPKIDAAEAQVTVNRFLLTVTTMVAVFATLVLLGLETHIVSTEGIVSTSYSFTIEKLLASVYVAK